MACETSHFRASSRTRSRGAGRAQRGQGFGGAGKAYGNLHSFSDAPTAFGFGTGFRYLVARKLGLSMGIDVAHGPGQNAFYIQVGSAWR